MSPTLMNQLDDAFTNALRLAIVSALFPVEGMDFTMLKKITGGTDGNLSIQARKLEEVDYIQVEKDFVDRKPKTTYRLTDKGREAFRQYVSLLEEAIRDKDKAF